MSLTLTVDGERWRSHLRGMLARHPGLVPVAKGNGYGFGLTRLAEQARWLAEQADAGSGAHLDTLAVGTYSEVATVADHFPGSLLVLTPWRPFGAALEATDGLPADRVIHTVSRPEDVGALLEREPTARLVLERMTTMQRHGCSARGLREAAAALAAHPRARLEGVALRLPLEQGSHLGEVRRLMTDVVAADLPTTSVWVSHLTDAELAALGSSYADYTWRPRIGTGLWLGDRAALRVTATVLDVHEVERGDVFGYRGRTTPKSGHLLVVSGGTAHGIGLEAPTGDSSLRSRAASLARGGLDAAGWVRSPFTIAGKQRLFAEPPHMQASMLFLPSGPAVPAIGDEIAVRVRYTATSFDRVVID